MRSSQESRHFISALREKRMKKENTIWGQKARYLDVIHGTKLGTLGYLPLEIRQQIWRRFFMFEARVGGYYDLDNLQEWNQHRLGPHDPFEPRIFYTGGRPLVADCYMVCPNLTATNYNQDVFSKGWKPRKPYVTWCHREEPGVLMALNLQMASPTILQEIQMVFLSTHQFTFSSPQLLFEFCEQLSEWHLHDFRHMMIWLGKHCRGPCWSWDRDMDGGKPKEERDIEQWRRAVMRLPSTVWTVLIRMGAMAVNVAQELRALKTIAEAIRKRAPDAEIKVARDGNRGRLSDAKRAVYESIVEDAKDGRPRA